MLVPLALAGALVIGACSDDEAEDEATETATAAASQAAGETVAVTAIDYGFEGLPSEVAAGTMLTLTNASTAEFHELVAVLLPAGEARTAEELLALSEEEQTALMSGEPAAVLVAMPGEAGIAVVGDGTLSEPGRYLILCAIPVGADPAAVMAAMSAATAAPELEGGAPHFTEGMFADVTVQ